MTSEAAFEIAPYKNDMADIQSFKRRFTVFKLQESDIKLSNLINELELNTRQLVIVQFLLLASQHTSMLTNQQLVDSILENYNIPTSSFRRHIQELIRLNVLTKIPVTLNGVPLNQGTCYKFCSSETIASSNNARKLFHATNSSQGNHTGARQSVTAALNSRGMRISDIDAKKYLSPGLLYDKDIIPLQYLAVSPERRNGKNFASATFLHREGREQSEYVVEASAHGQIATRTAFQTLMALINLSIAYNAKMLSINRYEEPFQIAEFPAHVLDILYVRGIQDSGQQRERIQNHIKELRETIFNWSELTGHVLDEDLRKLFTQKDFQFIIEVETNSQIAPVIRNGRIKSNPVLYFIQFHPRLVNLLKSKKRFFAIPWKIAQGDPLIFTLYLTLRTKRVEIESFELSSLRELMSFEGSEKQLYLDLKIQLDSYYQIEHNAVIDNASQDLFDYNLCGYHMRFNVNPNNKFVLYIACDHEEMIKESGATYNKALGRNNAPTLLNPIAQNLALTDELKNQAKIQQVITLIRDKYITKSTSRFTTYKKLFINQSEYTLTSYDAPEHVDFLAEQINKETSVPVNLATESLNIIKNELKPLSYVDLVIHDSDFYAFKTYLSEAHNLNLTMSEFIEAVKNFRKVGLLKWLNKEYDDLAELVLKKYRV